MNNMNNAIKPIPLNHIFVHRLVNTAEQREQSNWSRPVSFTLFSVVPEPVTEQSAADTELRYIVHFIQKLPAVGGGMLVVGGAVMTIPNLILAAFIAQFAQN